MFSSSLSLSESPCRKELHHKIFFNAGTSHDESIGQYMNLEPPMTHQSDSTHWNTCFVGLDPRGFSPSLHDSPQDMFQCLNLHDKSIGQYMNLEPPMTHPLVCKHWSTCFVGLDPRGFSPSLHDHILHQSLGGLDLRGLSPTHSMLDSLQMTNKIDWDWEISQTSCITHNWWFWFQQQTDESRWWTETIHMDQKKLTKWSGQGSYSSSKLVLGLDVIWEDSCMDTWIIFLALGFFLWWFWYLEFNSQVCWTKTKTPTLKMH